MNHTVILRETLDRKEYSEICEFLKINNIDFSTEIDYCVILRDDSGCVVGTGAVESNVFKYIAVDDKARGYGLTGVIISELISYAYSRGITNLFIYTKPENEDVFESLGFYKIMKTDDVLLMENKRDGFTRFLDQLCLSTKTIVANDDVIGSVVVNCNPFTLGHRYLVEEAASICTHLHIFVLGDKRSFFPPEDRMKMVVSGVSDLDNVSLHNGSEYMVSASTFPTYFRKDKCGAAKANCLLDIMIFAKLIAPTLSITKRFVGTEPTCEITGQYNVALKSELPKYGIDVHEIERKKAMDTVISASEVRKLYYDKNFDEIKNLVPNSTLDYLSL
ncbi:MAG: [citrate (pro-3S)-lyase] ligase [Suipraeoptans sp.]